MIPGSKGGQCVGLTTLHLHVPIVLKSGSLNLLEPSGPVKACNGIALPCKYVSISYQLTVQMDSFRSTVCIENLIIYVDIFTPIIRTTIILV
jgi:hypothetical protein